MLKTIIGILIVAAACLILTKQDTPAVLTPCGLIFSGFSNSADGGWYYSPNRETVFVFNNQSDINGKYWCEQ